MGGSHKELTPTVAVADGEDWFAEEEAEVERMAAEAARFAELSEKEKRAELYARFAEVDLRPEVVQYACSLVASLHVDVDKPENVAGPTEQLDETLERVGREDRELFQNPERQRRLIAAYFGVGLAQGRRARPRAHATRRAARVPRARRSGSSPPQRDEPSSDPDLDRPRRGPGRFAVVRRRA